MNTIDSSRFEDTNAIFETPENVDFEITEFLSDQQIFELSLQIRKKIF
jgi:hypothetical protein